MKKTSIQLSYLLMFGSLLLLFIFLGLYLKQVYDARYEAVSKEVAFYYSDAVDELEGEYLQRLLIGPLVSKFRDSSDTGERMDFMTIVQTAERFNMKKEFEEGSKDTTFRIEVKTLDAPLKLQSNIKGGISMSMKFDESEKMGLDSMFRNQNKKNIVVEEMLKAEMDSALLKNALPVRYEISVFQDTVFENVGLEDGFYRDMISGHTYFLQVDNYRQVVFKDIYREIIFSFLLFALVSLAFYVIHRNWQREQRLTALKNDFISNITHELKTPITTVGVAIEALSNFNALDDPAKTREYLDISKQELNRLSLLVDKVLKMSLFEQREPELKLESFDIAELTRDILASMRLQFEKAAARVDFQTIGESFMVRADRLHLMSVIYNLIDNALKYSPKETEIKVELERQNDQLALKVQDRGMGIPKAYQDKIFDKFFRVPTGDAHNIKGHGLGLSYVASVIQKHQGSISLDSEPGKGSLFTVKLPVELS